MRGFSSQNLASFGADPRGVNNSLQISRANGTTHALAEAQSIVILFSLRQCHANICTFKNLRHLVSGPATKPDITWFKRHGERSNNFAPQLLLARFDRLAAACQCADTFCNFAKCPRTKLTGVLLDSPRPDLYYAPRLNEALDNLRADVAELVDAQRSGRCGSNSVEVRFLSSASLIQGDRNWSPFSFSFPPTRDAKCLLTRLFHQLLHQ